MACHHTPADDGQMLLALAASLVNQRGRCVASDAATQYALAYDPQRGYGASAGWVSGVRGCTEGSPPLYPVGPLAWWSHTWLLVLLLQVLAQLQAQLAAGPLPATLGSELDAQGGSYGNGGVRVKLSLLCCCSVAPLAVPGPPASALTRVYHSCPKRGSG
jgi:hypothetical protein